MASNGDISGDGKSGISTGTSTGINAGINSEGAGIHGGLLDGPPPPQARTTPPWPGYDPEPAQAPHRAGLLARVFRGRRAARATA